MSLQLEPLESRRLLSVTPLLADANGDGRVDAADFDVLAQHFGQRGPLMPIDGDFNSDGVVNAADFELLAASYGQQIQFSPPITITASGTYSGAGKAPITTRP